jgi:uncharacterized protein (DUF885 family)
LRINAYDEGWALYAESLGHEMGLYDTTRHCWDAISTSSYRAARLVADTGHPREGLEPRRAIEYMMEEGGLGERAATHEVLRYMAWPAQALGYKVGEITLRDLRTSRSASLGDRFDVRDFHQRVLGRGQYRSTCCASASSAWIATRVKASRTK